MPRSDRRSLSQVAPATVTRMSRPSVDRSLSTNVSRTGSASSRSFGPTLIPRTGSAAAGRLPGSKRKGFKKEYDEDEFKNYGQFRSKQVRARNAARKLARQKRLAALKNRGGSTSSNRNFLQPNR